MRLAERHDDQLGRRRSDGPARRRPAVQVRDRRNLLCAGNHGVGRRCQPPSFASSAAISRLAPTPSITSTLPVWPIKRRGGKSPISRIWVEDNTGVSCLCFCPPLGRCEGRHLRMIRKAGYLGLRSVELLSIDFPRRQAELLLIPTTVQAFPHRFSTFARNAIKRRAAANLWRFLLYGRAVEWPVMAEALLQHVIARGGVFHLWGHSWGAARVGQWRRLEDVLRLMGGLAAQAPALTNGQLCLTLLSPLTARDQAATAAAVGG